MFRKIFESAHLCCIFVSNKFDTLNIESMKLEEITHLLLRKTNTPEQIGILLRSLKGKFMESNLILSEGSLLYRARNVESIDEINAPSDLSYTPSKYNNTYKRASTPNNTMFYGISGDTHVNSVCGCLGEVCDCLREHVSENKHYTVAIGIWETTRDLILPQIINPDGLNKSEAFGNIAEYHRYLNFLGEDANDVVNFQRLINHEFTKQVKTEEEYWISATFTEWVLSLNDSYDGIIYESVQSIDPKLVNNHCVALRPQVADNDLLFKEALIYEFDFEAGADVVPNLTKTMHFPLA